MHLPAEILLSVADSLGDIRDVYSWYAINPRHKAVLGPRLRRSYDGSLLAAEHGDVELLRGCLSTRPELRRRFACYLDHRYDNDLDCQTPLAVAAKHRQFAMIEVAVEAGLLAGHTWAPVYSFRNSDWAVFDSLMSYKVIRTDFLSANAVDMAIDAIKTADNEALQRLLDIPGMSDSYLASDRCPLLDATRCRNRAAMKILLKTPFVDINARAYFQPTALGAAVQRHDMESIRLLLSDARIDVNLGTPLPLVSAMREYADLVPLLFQHGADLSRADDADWTGLLEACRLNNLEMVQSCLDVDPSLRKYVPYFEERDNYGQLAPKAHPPICVAAGRGHFELVKLLLQHGADPNEACQSSAFHTPLYNHGGPYYPEIIEYMLPWINERTMTGDEDNDRMEPLIYTTATCSDCPAQRQLVKALIERGADVNCTRYGKPVLIAACEEGRDGIAQILIENGADLNRYYGGQTCLEFIEAKGSLRLIEIARNAKYS